MIWGSQGSRVLIVEEVVKARAFLFDYRFYPELHKVLDIKITLKLEVPLNTSLNLKSSRLDS